MNDPNGLVFYRGQYHLFFQNNPNADFFADIHWGHAISNNLMLWKDMPTALFPDDTLGQVYSGSAIVDSDNRSGLCADDPGVNVPCLLAFFTHSGGKDGLQKQSVAFSRDDGRSWTQYSGNPILLDPTQKDFRDPKVIWYRPGNKWIMVVAAGNVVRFYDATNLHQWSYLSEYQPGTTANGEPVECPDLFELPVDGDATDTRWVLQTNVFLGGPLGGSAARYSIGYFDGATFVSGDSAQDIRMLDYGEDFYASQSWSDIPDADGRRIAIAWMNNWLYAMTLPSDGWRGQMSLPRELTLGKDSNAAIELIQRPATEISSLYWGAPIDIQNKDLSPTPTVLLKDMVIGLSDITLDFHPIETKNLKIVLSSRVGERIEIGYDTDTAVIYVDRTAAFPYGYRGRQEAPWKPNASQLQIRILLDRSSIEVFFDGGRRVFSDLIAPESPIDTIAAFVVDGTATLKSAYIQPLRSAWATAE